MVKPSGEESQTAPELSQPRGNDIPVIGRRITEISLCYKLRHTIPNWTKDADIEAIVRFAGVSRTLTLPNNVVRLLRFCDGTRTYSEIAAYSGLEIGGVLQIAESLISRGVFDNS